MHGDPARGIPGCMEKQGLTEEEASRLFEQLMPFAAYGFNKSHAAAYAYVSFCTAYLKLTHTGDFYRSSIQHLDDNSKIAPFAAEAKEHYKINIAHPTLEHRDCFYNDETKTITLGYSKIKGVNDPSFEAYRDTPNGRVLIDNLQDFVIANPDVQPSLVDALARAGAIPNVFRGTPAKDRSEVVDYAAFLTPYLKQYAERHDEVAALGNYAYADNRAMNGSKVYRRATAQDEQQRDGDDRCVPVPIEKAETRKSGERTIGVPSLLTTSTGETAYSKLIEDLDRHKGQSMKYALNCDLELLGVSGESGPIIARLKEAYPNERKTLTDLRNAQKGTLPIACEVIGREDGGTTKNGRPFVKATLMDIEGNTFERRFDTAHALADRGVFSLYCENERYFISSTSISRDAKADAVNAQTAEEMGEKDR